MTSSKSIREKIINRWLEKLSSKEEISKDLVKRLKLISEENESIEAEMLNELIKREIKGNEVENSEN